MNKKDWLNKCLEWKSKWPVPQEQGDKLNDDSNGINLYKFYEVLNQNLKEDSIVTWDAGSSLYVSNQALRLNGKNQRSIGSLAQAEMGAGIAMSCGVSFAKNKGEVICCIGDGSLNTQVHSLAIARKLNLPIKIFVLNNRGYLSIKNSQDKFYEGRRIGTDSNDGLFFPEIEKLASAYDFFYYRVDKIIDLDYIIKKALKFNFPSIIEVICQEIQEISPGITATKNADGKLEQCDFSNMSPFIEGIENEMIKD